MKKLINTAVKCSTNSYKDFWAYKEVSKNWKSTVRKTADGANVTIWYDYKKKDPYMQFSIVKDAEYGDYWIYSIDDDRKVNITDEVDYADTLENCINACFYYFYSRA